MSLGEILKCDYSKKTYFKTFFSCGAFGFLYFGKWNFRLFPDLNYTSCLDAMNYTVL